MRVFTGLRAIDATTRLIESSKHVIARAEALRLLGRPWSLAELQADDDDFAFLCEWAEVLDYSRTRRYLEGGYPHTEAIGILLMLLAAEAGRRLATEGTLWSVVHPLVSEDVRPILFAGGQPTQLHKDALERAARHYNLRHVFGMVGTQNWFVSVFSQFGFTRRGFKRRLPEWLVGQGQTHSIRLLLDPITGSESFQTLWRNLRLYRQKRMSAADLATFLRSSPWTLPEWSDDLLKAAQQRMELGAGLTGHLASLDVADEDEPWFHPPLLVWNDGKAPHFETSIANLQDLDLSEPEYHVVADGERLAVLVRQEHGQYAVMPENLLTLSSDRPAATIQVQEASGDVTHSETLRLWDVESEVTAYRMQDGGPHDAWNEEFDRNRSYALCLSRDLMLDPPATRCYGRHGSRVRWVMLDSVWSADMRVLLDGEEFWRPLIRERKAVSQPEWVNAVLGTQQFGHEMCLSGELAIAVSLPAGASISFARSAGRSLPLQPKEPNMYRLRVPVPYGRGHERSVRIMLSLRRGSESARVSVEVPISVQGAAVLESDGWRPLDPEAPLSVGDALRPISILPPLSWNRRAMPWEDWAIVEGGVWRDLPAKTARPIRRLAGLGARLALRCGRYNATDTAFDISRSVIDPGCVQGIGLDAIGRLNSVRLTVPKEPDHRTQVIVLTKTGCIQSLVPSAAGAQRTWTVEPAESGAEIAAVGLAYAGARIGAWWAGDWSSHLADVSRGDSGGLAAWLRWMALPVLADEHFANVQSFARQNIATVLPAWILPDSAPNGFEYDPAKSEAWLSAVRELTTGWKFSSSQAVGLIDSLTGSLEGASVIERFAAACHLLARVHPLLMSRLLFAWGHTPGHERLLTRAFDDLIKRLLGPDTHASLEAQCVDALEVDPYFLKVSLLRSAEDQLYDGVVVSTLDENNLSLAVGACEPFRRLLAVHLAYAVRNNGNLPIGPRR